MSAQPLAQDVRNNMYNVDSRRLIEEEGFNRREDYGDIPMLAKSIKAQGLDSLTPLTCYKQGENYVVTRGHRRLKAIRILEQNGEILWVRILLERKGYSKEKRLLDQVTENEGKPYTPWEQAKVFRDLRGLGWSEKDIAEHSNRSGVYVHRLLSLADAPQKLINLVRENRVAATFAMDAIAEGLVEDLLEKAEQGEVIDAPVNPDLFPAGPPVVTKEKITRSKLKQPNSWKAFQKWVPAVKEEEISPEKAEMLSFLRRMTLGELTEEDFIKFFGS